MEKTGNIIGGKRGRGRPRSKEQDNFIKLIAHIPNRVGVELFNRKFKKNTSFYAYKRRKSRLCPGRFTQAQIHSINKRKQLLRWACREMRKNSWKGRTGYHHSPEVFSWKRVIRVRNGEGKTGSIMIRAYLRVPYRPAGTHPDELKLLVRPAHLFITAKLGRKRKGGGREKLVYYRRGQVKDLVRNMKRFARFWEKFMGENIQKTQEGGTPELFRVLPAHRREIIWKKYNLARDTLEIYGINTVGAAGARSRKLLRLVSEYEARWF